MKGRLNTFLQISKVDLTLRCRYKSPLITIFQTHKTYHHRVDKFCYAALLNAIKDLVLLHSVN
jgi:hypothetical protein